MSVDCLGFSQSRTFFPGTGFSGSDWRPSRIVADHDDLRIDIADMFEGAPFIDPAYDFERRSGTGVFEIPAIHNICAVREPAGRTYIRKTCAHVSRSA